MKWRTPAASTVESASGGTGSGRRPPFEVAASTPEEADPGVDCFTAHPADIAIGADANPTNKVRRLNMFRTMTFTALLGFLRRSTTLLSKQVSWARESWASTRGPRLAKKNSTAGTYRYFRICGMNSTLVRPAR